MTKNEKTLILFFLLVVTSGALFLTLSRFRFYQNYVQIMEKSAIIENSGVTQNEISSDTGKRAGKPIQRVDINTADINEIMGIPGIGRTTALHILEYRFQNGHFNHIQELLQVKGIGIKKLENIKNYIIINSDTGF
jgi:competence ComEA-like helix-hairpin-helix protein